MSSIPARPRTRAVARPFLILVLLLVSLLPGLNPGASAATPDRATAARAIDWLRNQQQPDGSFSAFGGPGDPGTTADVVFAFAAAGVDPHGVRTTGGVDAVTYLQQSGPAVAANPGLAAKVALALHAAGANPRDAGGVDLIVAIDSGYDPQTGWYGTSFYGHVFAVLALDAEGVPLEIGAVEALYTSQTPEGSWGFNGDTTPGTGDSNTTAFVIQTLVAIDGERNLIKSGLDYLRSLQDDNGAIAYDGNTVPLAGDANSTALAIQAFVAAGEDAAGLPKGDLVTALDRFANPSGALQFQPAYPDDSLLATAQAVPALMLVAYPIGPVVQDPPLKQAVAPAAPVDGCAYLEVTRHNLCGAFRDYWVAHGGLAIFGYPISEQFDEYGRQVQYFERARFEWHPENAGTEWQVLLTRLGADAVDRDYRDRTPVVAAQDGCTYFAVTGHNVCGPMATIWSADGGLAIFGYPLTEQFSEDGVTIQYFERARFEWRPGAWPDHLDVFFGRLAAEYVDRELAN